VTIKHSKVLDNDTIYAYFNYSDIVCNNNSLGMMDGMNFQYGFLLKIIPVSGDSSIKEGGL